MLGRGKTPVLTAEEAGELLIHRACRIVDAAGLTPVGSAASGPSDEINLATASAT